MAYSKEEMGQTMKEKVVDPRSKKREGTPQRFKWWLADNEKDLVEQVLSTRLRLTQTTRI